ncbi:hypothetical protein MRX96_025239 [Rhipicephalus microplus]
MTDAPFASFPRVIKHYLFFVLFLVFLSWLSARISRGSHEAAAAPKAIPERETRPHAGCLAGKWEGWAPASSYTPSGKVTPQRRGIAAWKSGERLRDRRANPHDASAQRDAASGSTRGGTTT